MTIFVTRVLLLGPMVRALPQTLPKGVARSWNAMVRHNPPPRQNTQIPRKVQKDFLVGQKHFFLRATLGLGTCCGTRRGLYYHCKLRVVTKTGLNSSPQESKTE
eukprot:977840-Amphidinium_carterae.1